MLQTNGVYNVHMLIILRCSSIGMDRKEMKGTATLERPGRLKLELTGLDTRFNAIKITMHLNSSISMEAKPRDSLIVEKFFEICAHLSGNGYLIDKKPT